MQLYIQTISRIDIKLVDILEKIGTNVFDYVGTSNEKQAPNPMKLFQNMLSAGASASNSKPAPKNNLDTVVSYAFIILSFN